VSRTVSLNARQAMNAEETGAVPVILLTITHSDLPDPLRLSSDPTTRLTTDPLTYGTVSRGNQFLFLPFSAVLPDDKDEAPPQARIMIDNIDRELIPILRSTSTPAAVTIEMVLAGSPDVVEMAFAALDLVAADYDAAAITISLQMDAFITEPYPSDSLNPSNFPGLF
jgi:hypothetical protein